MTKRKKIIVPAVSAAVVATAFAPFLTETPLTTQEAKAASNLLAQHQGLSNLLVGGGEHSAAIMNGHVFTWGANDYGKLGQSKDNIVLNEPTKVNGLVNVVAVSPGYDHTAAVTADGSLYTWGYNAHGELGHGDTTDKDTPTKVQGISNVVAVSAGGFFTAAITADGSLYTWGQGFNGQLGHGNTKGVNTPTKVQGISNVVAVSISSSHTAAITADGSLYTWGANYPDSQLGHGDTTARTVPTKVTRLSNVVSVQLGMGYSVALTADGSVYTWGSNDDGQLGTGDTNIRAVPTKITSLSNIASIETGDNHTIAVTRTGDLFTWGVNDEGQLGVNDRNPRLIPTKVESLSNVKYVTAGDDHTIAITADDSLYGWGFNNRSQLTDIGYYSVAFPMKISSRIIPSINTDTTPPVLANLIPSTTALTNQNVSVTIGYSSDAATKQYRLGTSGAWQTYTGPISISSNTTVYARSVDEVGNESVASYTINNIDKLAPTAPLITHDRTKNEITITSGSDASGIKEVRYQINDGAWEVYTDKLVLADGTYTVNVKTIDTAGNESVSTSQTVVLSKQAYENTLNKVEKAEDTFAKGDYPQAQLDKDTAQGLVNQLGDDDSRKQGLQNRLDALQENIDNALAEQERNTKYEALVQEATQAVEKAEDTFADGDYAQAQLDKDTAQGLVDQLNDDDSRKDGLQGPLDALQQDIDNALAQQAKYEAALQAVEKAEGSFASGDLSQAQLDKDAAEILVNQLGDDDSHKQELQDRLDALQQPTNINTAPTVDGQIPNQTVRVDASPIQVDIANHFQDAEGDNLTYEVKSVSNANASVTINDSIVEITPNRVGPTNITIKATDPSGLSVEQTFTVNVTQAVLTAPANVQATADSPTQVTITFDQVDGATEYVIKRNGVIVGQATNGAFVDTNARHNQTYTYEVLAKNQFTQSAPATTDVTTPIQYRSVTIEWEAHPDAIGYDVYRDGQKIGDTMELTFTDTQAVEGESYRYKVVTITAIGEGSSNEIDVIVPGEDTSKDVDLTGVKVKSVQAEFINGVANIKWDTFDDATRYRVQTYVYDEATGEFVKQGFLRSVTTNKLTLNALQEGQKYQFEVIPFTNKMLPESAGMSNVVEFTVAPSSVEEESMESRSERYNFQVNVEGTTATLSWDAMEDVSRYRVSLHKKNDVGEFKQVGAARAISETTFTYNNLLENAEYEFIVEPRIGYIYDRTQALLGMATTTGTATPPPVEETPENFIPNLTADMQGKTATISWDGITIGRDEITTYRLVRYVKDDMTGQYKADGLTRAVTGTSYKDTYKLVSGKTYKYEVLPRVGWNYDASYTSTISDLVNP